MCRKLTEFASDALLAAFAICAGVMMGMALASWIVLSYLHAFDGPAKLLQWS